MSNLIFTTKNIGIFVLLLFHISGFIGMVWSPYRDWFLGNTPLNLGVAAVCVLANIANKNKAFGVFSLVVAVFGFGIEYVGITTQFPFGAYSYSHSILGWQAASVPVLMGVLWWLQVYTYGVLSIFLTTHLSINSRFILFINSAIAAALMTIADYPMELLANKIRLWQWQFGFAPIQNYLAWFVCGFLLQLVFNFLPFGKQNTVAIVYTITTFLFFCGLNLFL